MTNDAKLSKGVSRVICIKFHGSLRARERQRTVANKSSARKHLPGWPPHRSGVVTRFHTEQTLRAPVIRERWSEARIENERSHAGK